jgi:hypothetical protein
MKLARRDQADLWDLLLSRRTTAEDRDEGSEGED